MTVISQRYIRDFHEYPREIFSNMYQLHEKKSFTTSRDNVSFTDKEKKLIKCQLFFLLTVNLNVYIQMFNNMQNLVPMTISQFFAPSLQHKNHPRDFLPIPQELANDTCSQHPPMQAMTCGYRHCFIVFKRLKNVHIQYVCIWYILLIVKNIC